MHEPEQFRELRQYVLENPEFLLGYTSGLAPPHNKFIADHHRFQEKFNDVATDPEIIKEYQNLETAEEQAHVVLAELIKFSRTKVRHALLREYRELCASLRVLNLFSLYQNFFLAPYFNQDLLEIRFNSNPRFLTLNQNLKDLFTYEDKRKTSRSSPRCKEYYFGALKRIVFFSNQILKPSGIEAGNFRELSQFFANHPLIRDFFDDHLDEITHFAIIFYDGKSPSPTYLKSPEDIKKLRASKRKLDKSPADDSFSAGLFKTDTRKKRPDKIEVPKLIQHPAWKIPNRTSTGADSQRTGSPPTPL